MIVKEWRLDMQLKSPQMLKQYMDYKRYNIRSLAKAAGISHSTVGHLHSGKRRTCSPEVARAIEEALQAPPGLLFDPRATNVSREVGRREKVAA